MKSIFFTVTLLALSTATPSFKDEWTSFKKQHGKSYKSQAEENLRLSVFMDNMKFIEEHNARFEAGMETYYLRMNSLGDMLSEEVSFFLLGLNEDYSDGIEQPMEFIPPANIAIPESVDWRKIGAVTPVKSQGHCGSCWAFSATGSMEGQLFRKTGKLIPLSEQQLIDCDRGLDNGCGGGLAFHAFRYLKDRGLQSEDTYPYEAKDNKCRFNERKVVNGTKVRSWTIIRNGDLDALQKAVATVGPISVSINTKSKSFRFYGGGILTGDGCDPSSVNHAVLLVGYGSENGKDYWIVKNSWNTWWGEKGYIRFERNSNNTCGIATHPSYPLL
ncbi:unnamed protein product [Nezara viridula]|uniref:Uncharacterized protein n=1 Tax=Nezara viridula TaxID=85310 RepID=A0A9P0EE86_NEZVI|nr:unnamed protein product [Nezara viridula]